MKTKERIQIFYQKVNNKFSEQFGFKIKDVTFNKVIDYMYTPRDSSSLAITRILFGLAMLFDIPDERGGAALDKLWGNPSTCHFPLFPALRPIGLPHMAVVYAALWLGAVGIMLGYKYRVAAPMFTSCYWYLFLIEKSFWNNHSYLFGLVAFLMCFTQANCYWSLDAYLDPKKKQPSVPYWNYFLLKYQFFILYFMAGMKKGTAEWLTGYSVQNLSEHWVFDPFKFFLTVQQTDYLVVHWFVFFFDLTVAVWMMRASTRHAAMVLCAMFHIMNSRLFRIGMFPWVCLATMPLYYPFDWPKTVISYSKAHYAKLKSESCKKINEFGNKFICQCNTFNSGDTSNKSEENKEVIGENITAVDKEIEVSEENTKVVYKTDVSKEIIKPNDNFNQDNETNDNKDTQNTGNYVHDDDYKKKKVTLYLIMLYVFVQAFLPYSHFITKGYNNWTNGLYGYSWDMMVHTWDISSVVVKVVDNDSNEQVYVDPQQHTINDRWSRHGDMVVQYAQCLKNILDQAAAPNKEYPSKVSFKNVSVYVDIWCAMNGRFVQRMFDPKVDLLRASWSPFCKVPYLMPLLDEAIHWRKDMDKIRNDVHSWSEHSDVVFYADFPGYEQEKYIPLELKNVTLTVLEGTVVFEPEVTNRQIGQSFLLTRGNRFAVDSGRFHKVLNIDEKPVYYMYNFFNSSEVNVEDTNLLRSKLPIFRELFRRLTNMVVFGNLVAKNMFQLLKFTQCNL